MTSAFNAAKSIILKNFCQGKFDFILNVKNPVGQTGLFIWDYHVYIFFKYTTTKKLGNISKLKPAHSRRNLDKNFPL